MLDGIDPAHPLEIGMYALDARIHAGQQIGHEDVPKLFALGEPTSALHFTHQSSLGQCRTADDVHDRIERADFVQVHAIEADAVHRRFGFTKRREQLLGARLARGAQRRTVDQL